MHVLTHILNKNVTGTLFLLSQTGNNPNIHLQENQKDKLWYSPTIKLHTGTSLVVQW